MELNVSFSRHYRKKIAPKGASLIRSLAQYIDLFIQKLWTIVETRLTARLRQTAYIFMFALFIGGIVYIFYQDPEFLSRIEPWPVVGLALLMPLRLAINVIRYTILARILDQPMNFQRALSVVIAGNAANFLPLPGGLMVRAAGLSDQGQGYTRGLGVNVAGSLVWLGTAGIFSATGAFALSLPLIGGSLIAGGTIALAIGIRQLMYWRPSLRIIGTLMGANLAFCFVASIRFALALMAVGLGLELARPVLMSISGPLGLVTALAPGALGISEAIATALGVASGLEATETFAAAAIVRIVSFSVFACITLGISYRSWMFHHS